MIIEIPNENSIIKWKNDEKDEWKVAEISDLIKAYERPRGEWVGNAFDEHHCKRCGHPALWEEEPDGYYEVQSRFCPNCGAKMEVKKND